MIGLALWIRNGIIIWREKVNRQVGVRRLYSLGDFKNVTFDDVYTDVPTDLAFDPDLVGQIKFLQVVSIEIAFRKYLNIMEKYPLTGEQRMVEALEQLRQDTINSIQEIINGKTEA